MSNCPSGDIYLLRTCGQNSPERKHVENLVVKTAESYFFAYFGCEAKRRTFDFKTSARSESRRERERGLKQKRRFKN